MAKSLNCLNAARVEVSGDPGEVVAIDDESFTVATSQGGIKVMRVRAEAGKVSAKEYIDAVKLAVGDSLG